MKHIVAVVGDYYHPKELPCEALESAAGPITAGGMAEIRFTSAEMLAGELDGTPDAIILFAENRIDPEAEQVRSWMNDEIEERLCRYVENGGALLAWHSGLASYNNCSRYIDMLKGYFIHHPARHRPVFYTGLMPAATGVPQKEVDFEAMDEQYFVHCDEEQTQVFLRSSSAEDGQSAAGWKHLYGQGRVCCLTPGHTREALLHPSMQELLRRCVEWCLDR